MRWIPAPRRRVWAHIAGAIALVQFIAIGGGISLMLPHAEPKFLAIALFCLLVGGIIGGAGWLGARWFPLLALAGVMLGLVMMLGSFTGGGGWEDLVGILTLLVFYAGGMVIGLLIELVLYLRRKIRGEGV